MVIIILFDTKRFFVNVKYTRCTFIFQSQCKKSESQKKVDKNIVQDEAIEDMLNYFKSYL